jgi:hypothetical protein
MEKKIIIHFNGKNYIYRILNLEKKNKSLFTSPSKNQLANQFSVGIIVVFRLEFVSDGIE